jgi:hypothetical protein
MDFIAWMQSGRFRRNRDVVISIAIIAVVAFMVGLLSANRSLNNTGLTSEREYFVGRDK